MKLKQAIKKAADCLEAKLYNDEYVSKCPFCESDKHKFYLNARTGLYSCKRASCAESGNLTTLFKKLGFTDTIEYPEEEYNLKEITKKEPISTESIRELRETDTHIIDYMMSRGISYDTLKKHNVFYSEKYDAMCFVNYDKANKPIGVVYRKVDKKIRLEKGSDLALWGKENLDISKSDTLYIAEGHPDALTLMEMGIDNVVSVPNGAAAHDWINKDWDVLNKFKRIVLCYDNDEAGKNAIEKVKNRLDFATLFVLEYGDYKDVNDMYMGNVEGLYKTVRNPKEISMDGFISLKDVKTNKDRLSGMSSCGLAQLDRIMGGFENGECTIIAAASGSGKTTVVANLANGFIANGERVAIWSGELNNQSLKTWIYGVIAGQKAIVSVDNPFRKGDKIAYLKEEYEQKIDKAVEGKLFVYDGNKNNAFTMLKHFELLHKKNGVTVFFIDNGSILDMSVSGKDKYVGEEEFAKRLAAFLRENPVKVFLVMHPTKTVLNSDPNYIDSKGRVKRPEKYNQYQVKGSSALVNLAYNILFLNRATDHHKAYYAQLLENQLKKAGRENEIPQMVKLINNELSLIMYLDKNRMRGFVGEDALFGYSNETRRIYGLTSKEEDLSKEVISCNEVEQDSDGFEEIGLDDF